MIKEVIGTGETIEEAKEKAIEGLNARPDDDIQFEVLSFPKKKTLGLFGGSEAKVRVFIDMPDPKPKKESKPSDKQNNNNRPSQRQNAPANKENRTSEKPAAKTENRTPKKPEQKTEQKAERPQQKQVPQNKPVQEKPVQNDVKPNVSPADIADRALTGFGPAVDSGEIAADSQAGMAVAYLKSVLSKLGCDNITVKVATKENAALLTIDGEGLGVIIGRRGETLDALQYLSSLAANNANGYYKVTLNIGDYRERRQQSLVSLAGRMASQVLRTGKSRTLEPMNPYERRIIHTAVQDIAGVVSVSVGEGAGRRVVISKEGVTPSARPQQRRGFSPRNEHSERHTSSAPAAKTQSAQREPKKDSEVPLYGKIN